MAIKYVIIIILLLQGQLKGQNIGFYNIPNTEGLDYYKVVYNSDGSILAGVTEGKVTLWDSKNMALYSDYNLTNTKITALSFETEGNRFAVGTVTGQFLLINENGDIISEYNTRQASPITSIIHHSSLNYYLGSDVNGNVHKWNDQGKLVENKNLHDEQITDIAFSEDGLKLITSSSDRTIKIWTINDFKLLKVLAGHNDWVRQIAVNTEFLASAGDDKTIMIWDLDADKLQPRQQLIKNHHNWISALEFTTDNQYLITLDHDGKIVLSTGFNSNKPIRKKEYYAKDKLPVGFQRYPTSIAVNPRSFQVAVSYLGGVLVNDYYQLKYLKSHEIIIESINENSINRKISEYITKQDTLLVKGKITRPETIASFIMRIGTDQFKATWDRRSGNFTIMLDIKNDTNRVIISIKDQDPLIDDLNLEFTITKSNN